MSAAGVVFCRIFLCIYDSFHVVHAAVAYFNIVLVKDFVKFTSFWKVFFNDMYEFSADVSGNIFAEWWIIPNYFPISVASLFVPWFKY